jgi:hypothetical protein
MSEHDGETAVLDFLRASFARQDEQHDRTRRILLDHTERLTRLESTLVGVRRDNADLYGHVIALTHRLDGVADRLDRIERRLGLVDAS